VLGAPVKEFSPFRLDPVNQCLWRGKQRLVLRPKPFAILQYLVDRAGRLVTQTELLEALWPGTFVQPEVLKTHIGGIRNALGDDPKHPKFIETLPRRGYRFIAPIHVRISPLPDASASPAPEIVGRETELLRLRDYLSKASAGQRQIVFITGEFGVGKTALANAFEATAGAAGVRIIRGECVEGFGNQEAYYPFLSAFGRLFQGPDDDALIRMLLSLAPTCMVQFPGILQPQQRKALQAEVFGAKRERMLREICHALEAITAENSLMIILEDLHWGDRSTVELIGALARSRVPAKLMLIVTYRPIEVMLSEHPLREVKQRLLVHHLCQEMEIEPLPEREVAKFVATKLSNEDLPDGLVGLIYRHSEGNPLFMAAALEVLSERGLLSREDGHWKLTHPPGEIDTQLPENLRRMLEIHIERLSEDERQALEAASVNGLTFSVGISSPVAGLEPEEFERLCDAFAQSRHFLCFAEARSPGVGARSDRYAFVHALYREVLYHGIPPLRRSRLHKRNGQVLETLFADQLNEVAAELALHFEKAGEYGRAIKYLLMVADKDVLRFAHDEAVPILKHALTLLEEMTERERAATELDILEKLGTVYFAIGISHSGMDTFEALAEKAEKYQIRTVQVRALLHLASPLVYGSPHRVVLMANRALELNLQESDPQVRTSARLRGLYLRIRAGGWNIGDAEECRATVTRASPPEDVLVWVLVQYLCSEYESALRDVERILPVFLERGNLVAYSTARLIHPWILLLSGKWGEAFGSVQSSMAQQQKNERYVDDYRIEVVAALLHLFAMDFPYVVETCTALLPQSQSRQDTRRLLMALGWAETGLGKFEEGLKHLTEARELMNREPLVFDWYYRMPLQQALTDQALKTGNISQAHQEAEKFLSVTLATSERTWQALAWEARARVALADSDREHARADIQKAIETIEGFDLPLADWRVHSTAMDVFPERAEHHRRLSAATAGKLADSLVAFDDLKRTFLSSELVVRIFSGLVTPSGLE
jgi:DNA-binding winged helix-turn-helix (wHTH) protein/tetratricopeptide (TPR) repeat protein